MADVARRRTSEPPKFVFKFTSSHMEITQALSGTDSSSQRSARACALAVGFVRAFPIGGSRDLRCEDIAVKAAQPRAHSRETEIYAVVQ
jgi:hypothetical protein